MAIEAPVGELAFTLERIAELDRVLATGAFGDLNAETARDILAEAARFAAEELAPLGAASDHTPPRLADGKVTTTPGWPDVYRHWREAGWNGFSAPAEWGGQGLPIALHMAVQELWNWGSTSFAAGPMLTAGAIDALDAHGSTSLKALYLPKLTSGVWMATMNLTEPQAGSDLGALRTRAERAGDGTYRIFGQKIFITYGEHDLSENIVHLVLARLPDAPPGTAGISLFLVPKFIPDAAGNPGERNDVVCAGLEEKLGLHGSPTCVMVHGETGRGAVGYLVGEENRGLACMFTMMNVARLTVGLQGVGVAERAYGQALDYARSRLQGRPAGTKGAAMSPIIVHPDVRRELVHMKALVAAARAIAYSCAAAVDLARHGPAAERAFFADRVALLTPLAKAFPTDVGIEVASRGIQVHGGTGYIEETGAARHLRDARIFAIYEGTNGIQAVDLVTRKLRLGKGAALAAYLGELDAIADAVAASNRAGFGRTAERLREGLDALRDATAFLVAALDGGRTDEALAGATPCLRLFALTAGTALVAKGALAAESEDGPLALARYLAETVLGESPALAATVTGGAPALSQASAALFGFDPA